MTTTKKKLTAAKKPPAKHTNEKSATKKHPAKEIPGKTETPPKKDPAAKKPSAVKNDEDVDDPYPAGTSFEFEFVDPEEYPDEFVDPEEDPDGDPRSSCWFHMSNPEELEFLRCPNEVLIDAPAIKIAYQYPFSDSFEFVERAPDPATGFTRRDLLAAIATRYQQMYDEEDATSTIEAGPIGHSGGGSSFCRNRTGTNGKYGICGHVLSDLSLHTVQKHATGVWVLGIDS